MTLRVQDLRAGKTVRVHSVGRVEVEIDLGLGVHKQHIFALEDLQPKRISDELRSKACHCLVVLIGGKRLLVQPEHLRPDAKRARLFLTEKIYGSPVGIVQHAPGIDRPILDVSVFMEWLSGSDFDVAKVREVTNGTHERSATDGQPA